MKRFIIAIALLFALPVYADSPGALNLTASQGEDFSKTIVIQTCSAWNPTYTACTGTTTPMNLTGYTFRAQVRQNYTDAAAFSTFSTSTTPLIGTVTLRLNRSKTDALANKSAFWDLAMTAPSGDISYLLRGTFTVKYSATR